jgi:2-hydroxycyclohexanecarboxyl-CoA dehydrogenase
MNYPDLKGKVAVVTGGTRGVGLSVAEVLAREGAHVTVTGRSAEHADSALERLRVYSSDVAFVQGNSGEYESAKTIVDTAAKASGGIDLLISSGAEGPFGPRPFADMSAKEIEQSFSTRFYPRIFPVHAAIPHLRAKAGSVVMITTDAARVPTPGESIIGAVGASIILMTKALAREFSRWSIRVNSVAMTLTSNTPSWDRIFGKEDFETKVFAKALERFPSGHAPTSEEVARIVVFLLSQNAQQMTGQTLSVNGGLSFGGW